MKNVRLMMMTLMTCLVFSCSQQEEKMINGMTESEFNQKHDEITAQFDFKTAKIKYSSFINPILTPGENCPERWEILKEFRSINEKFPNSIYSDSAKMYIDSLNCRFDDGTLR